MRRTHSSCVLTFYLTFSSCSRHQLIIYCSHRTGLREKNRKLQKYEQLSQNDCADQLCTKVSDCVIFLFFSRNTCGGPSPLYPDFDFCCLYISAAETQKYSVATDHLGSDGQQRVEGDFLPMENKKESVGWQLLSASQIYNKSMFLIFKRYILELCFKSCSGSQNIVLARTKGQTTPKV